MDSAHATVVLTLLQKAPAATAPLETSDGDTVRYALSGLGISSSSSMLAKLSN